ncbi:type II toxin-antitoxin system VapC family toxin [Niabella drilacis]|uniref:Predicted nucleic acid-binding protein, contains PIN domain n=1 Tax=Niabella drilacis (strain DSM 25811 / CCM 8410 / CCUG 62505 / LMG 26954 / E90) TaxID=1285928 RepID=A0A1G6XVC8_NIADE|nr:PIN domain-containing protein [Niabella drilacis]SDD81633.1 Predicted nucleic acid-binding protein, contains PIN domain [Niabella drilacis]
MVSKVFFDANILLDFTLKRANFELAKKLFEYVVNGKFTAFITPSILHIVAYWLTKAYGSEKTKTLLLELLVDIRVIDAPHEIAVMALNSRFGDIEDALQYYTALHHDMNVFVSEDAGLKKSAISSLPVCTIKEFIHLLES